MSGEILFQVRIRDYGSTVYATKDCSEEVLAGDTVVLRSEKGLDWGKVVSSLFLEEEASVQYKIERKATPDDLERISKEKEEISEVMRIIRDKVHYHNLDMNLISAEYTFDRGKLIVYFVAEDRVDFRQLVRDLARTFKTRIEMRQIGVRDGAKMLGGLGICGRELCCHRFLREFKSMSIKMAKDQNLSLNPHKISGICGRLMCCLGYEWDVYREMLKKLPKIGQSVETSQGVGRVVELDILKGVVKVELGEGEEKRFVWEKIGGRDEG